MLLRHDDELLARDHLEIDELANSLGAALDQGDISLIHANLDLFWARLAVHIRAEHLHLFPTILKALNDRRALYHDPGPSFVEAHTTVEILRHDHDFFMQELSRGVLIIRDLLRQSSVQPEQIAAVRTSVAAVEARLADHNRFEEESIYRWTRNLLSEGEQAKLGQSVEQELNNMPPRFSAQKNS
jgi:hemerythrin superfamily protein